MPPSGQENLLMFRKKRGFIRTFAVLFKANIKQNEKEKNVSVFSGRHGRSGKL